VPKTSRTVIVARALLYRRRPAGSSPLARRNPALARARLRPL